MKTILLLLAAFSTATHAQAIHRCEEAAASVSYRDTPCAAPVAGPGADPVLASPGDWEIGQPSARRDQAGREGSLIALRVQARQKVLDDRDAALHAESRQRCEVALRVADRCGKFAGQFLCDDKGFIPVARDAAPRPVTRDNAGRYEMERCASQEAAKK